MVFGEFTGKQAEYRREARKKLDCGRLFKQSKCFRRDLNFEPRQAGDE